MKKIAIVAILALATVSFAMKYTGYVYLNTFYKTMYVSPGCTAKNADGIVESVGKKDILVTDKDAFGWFKIPVKKLLVADTLAPFCFYNGVQDTLKKVTYDADSNEVVTKTLYHYSSGVYAKDIFDGQEDVYIDSYMNNLYYKTLDLPTMFLKTDWKNTYVILDNYRFVKASKKDADGWTIIHDELKNLNVRRNIQKTDSTRTVSYVTDSHCLTDSLDECLIDEDTGDYIIVKDTTDSLVKWSFVYDTLAIDTLYSAYTGQVTFSDSTRTCSDHFVYKNVFNVGGEYNGYGSSEYLCLKNGLGFELQDSIYIFENPKKAGETLVRTKKPEKEKYLYVLPPQVLAWFGEIPSLSFDGGKTLTTMNTDAEHCGWFMTMFFEDDLTKTAAFYSKDSKKLVFGKQTKLDSLYKKFNTNVLFYVANDDVHWYKKWPEVDGICTVELRGIVYDTDASLHPAFSCYAQGGEGCQMGAQDVDRVTAVTAIEACIGLTPGLVESELGADHKPVLSKTGKKCFIQSDYFNQLFNSTDGVNETTCATIPFMMNRYGKWEFASDYYVSPGTSVMGGYYPVEKTDDADVVTGTPVLAARTKRDAEGPVFIGPSLRQIDSTEKVMKMNLLCNGPAWDKGYNCDGLFADGDDLQTSGIVETKGTYEETCVWGWSCPNLVPEGWPLFKGEKMVGFVEDFVSSGSFEPRWRSLDEGRNQHFCFESHAKFMYKKGLRFGVRGDDDIWIFIAGKLAIDLGGTHLAAPGYADLDQFKGKDGEPLTVGKTYDIDIFFCDRRTTMSNMNFYSNIYLDQSESAELMKPCKVEEQHIFDDDSLNPNPRVNLRDIALPSPKIGVTVQGREAIVSGLAVGSEVVLLDLQGRIIKRARATTADMRLSLQNPGRYILKTRSGLVPFAIK